MNSALDPNFDQLLIICGIISVIVIAFVLFVIKLPDEESRDDLDSHSPKKETKANCSRSQDEDEEF
ncbi:MAG: Uncharacterised protein [Glaciecola sp. HTCC2999]|jgi:hypothetical protein|nr:MAG: Uncharacterised protein [Glaciecola sp. HTCC2999]